MRTALLVAVGLVAAVAAPARADDCERACTHMRVVSEKELATMPGMSLDEKKRIQAQSTANEPARMQKCVAGCREGRVDAACVLRARDTMSYFPCLKPRARASSEPTPDQKRVLDDVRASAAFRGRALPSAERDRIVRALATATPRYALQMLGAALSESGAPMYGDDLVPAFRALSEEGMGHSVPRILQALSIPLAQLGCARTVADAARLAPGEAQRQVVAACPPAPAAHVVEPGAAASIPLDRLLLAIVVDGRARQSGLTTDPLHQRAMQILLGR